jgi:HPt (histidine-containing phosphotransfer) domain-containing protein
MEMHKMMQQKETIGAELNNAIDQIRRKFVGGLDESILDIEALQQMILKGERPDLALAEIVRRAHKIRGVAGTLGLYALGDAAGQLEDAYYQLSERLNGHLTTLSNCWSMIAQKIEALLAEMETALDS